MTTTTTETTATTETGPWLIDYVTGEELRRATAEEIALSLEAEAGDIGHGTGVIIVDDRRCYVA